jgi:hypothetical protein
MTEQLNNEYVLVESFNTRVGFTNDNVDMTNRLMNYYIPKYTLEYHSAYLNNNMLWSKSITDNKLYNFNLENFLRNTNIAENILRACCCNFGDCSFDCIDCFELSFVNSDDSKKIVISGDEGVVTFNKYSKPSNN